MKKLSNLLIALTFLSVSFIACEEDPVTPDPVGPTIAFSAGAGTIEGPADIPVNTAFTVTVITVAGDGNINQIAVLEDGSAIDASRVTLQGNAAGSNPSPIDVTTFGSGFTWAIGINTSDAVDVTRTYTVRITDENGLSDELSVDITQINGLTETTMMLLSNQGGPAGTGGLDLNTGTQTGTQATDTSADIRDLGIDTDLVLADNWIQKIGVINNSELVIPDASFDYDAAASTAELSAAFELGTSVTETPEKVMTGDVLLVKSEGVYFALKITNVTVTVDDNTDFYEMSVKQ